ncbi:MAG: hypothetical protein LC796_08960 [Acidobacteria bacterium]|nr:hypothetical protein [Acidobacteriota bacterium]MCA1612019.1 hypothetical protein [Acidobacteriota bacterium]
MKKNPTALAFHGLTIRSPDPEALAGKCQALLGWQVLVRGRGRIVLGDGPELFLEIRRGRRGEPEGVQQIHLAVKHLERGRRAASRDDLGGDSWSRPLTPALGLTLRQFRRAPSPQWRKKRKRV